jgi:hypothetical protein
MKTEAITAAMQLLELKLINEQQFAELVVKSLNGHAAPAVQQQLPIAQKRVTRNFLTIRQMDDIVQMYASGKSHAQIVLAMNQRHDTSLTVKGCQTIINRIRRQALNYGRYLTPEWQQYLAIWKQQLS